ncbi:MAG: hypothetical protein H7X99_08165 [Saprospiraceae bacterium]|nr:hypothetical protein [Saprospiraceae bacterium]
MKEPVYIFNNTAARDITLTVHSWLKDQTGTISIPLPKGWKSTPQSIDFSISQKGESKEFVFSITPPEKGEEIYITPEIRSNGKIYRDQLIDISYDHIPFQTVVMKAEAKLSRIDIAIKGKRVAYVMGAGDDIPISLRQIGYEVDLVKAEDISHYKLAAYDALIMGVRAYNTVEALKFKQKDIINFVAEGGTVIVQYNTAGGLVTKDVGPYPFTISRKRVSVEEAEIRFLNPEHELLNRPNKITSKDFEGWVQERGLYFPEEWDTNYTPILSSNDPGENPNNGMLLVAKHGDGHFIYTGLSFFRELPAGVSGAFRLFANLISIGKDVQP